MTQNVNDAVTRYDGRVGYWQASWIWRDDADLAGELHVVP